MDKFLNGIWLSQLEVAGLDQKGCVFLVPGEMHRPGVPSSVGVPLLLEGGCLWMEEAIPQLGIGQYSTSKVFALAAKMTQDKNPWFLNQLSVGFGALIEDFMDFSLFESDPAKNDFVAAERPGTKRKRVDPSISCAVMRGVAKKHVRSAWRVAGAARLFGKKVAAHTSTRVASMLQSYFFHCRKSCVLSSTVHVSNDKSRIAGKDWLVSMVQNGEGLSCVAAPQVESLGGKIPVGLILHNPWREGVSGKMGQKSGWQIFDMKRFFLHRRSLDIF